MADNKTKATGEVRNVRIQIGYQAYLVDFLVLDIPVKKELLLLLGCPFLRTCGAIIDMGRGTMTIDDGVIRHTYFPKQRAKAYLENFELIHFLGTLSVQLKHTDWGFEGHEVYRKTKGDGLWHAKFEVITPSGCKFLRGFKTKETKRKLSRKFTLED
ncbi:putative ribonuclease H-like domain-containing protein, partial [Tanacetum coccineum]